MGSIPNSSRMRSNAMKLTMVCVPSCRMISQSRYRCRKDIGNYELTRPQHMPNPLKKASGPSLTMIFLIQSTTPLSLRSLSVISRTLTTSNRKTIRYWQTELRCDVMRSYQRDSKLSNRINCRSVMLVGMKGITRTNMALPSK